MLMLLVQTLLSEPQYLTNNSVPTGEGNGNPLQYSCLENPRDRGAWWAAIYGVACMRWRRKWQLTPVLLPGEPKGWRSLVGCHLWGRMHALEKEMATTPVFLPGESQGWRSLVGCRLWGRTESDMIEAT